MTSKEISEWMAFDSIEPIGEIRADLRAGIVASTIANVHRRRGAPGFKPKGFMPFLDQESKPMLTPEVAYDALLAIAKSHAPTPAAKPSKKSGGGKRTARKKRRT